MTNFQPSIARRIFAHLFMLTTIACSCTGAAVAVRVFSKEVTFDFVAIAAYILCILFSTALSWLFAALLLWKWFAHLGLLIGGCDFREGDIVYIAKGPHKGISAPIYEIWSTRYQVRVFIGDNEKKTVRDVFNYNEVINLSR